MGDATVANLTELRSISFESISTTITTLYLMYFQVILSIQTCLIYIEMQNWYSRNTNYCIPVFIYIRIFKDIKFSFCFSEIVYLFNIFYGCIFYYLNNWKLMWYENYWLIVNFIWKLLTIIIIRNLVKSVNCIQINYSCWM